jgi:hypothetical protein
MRDTDDSYIMWHGVAGIVPTYNPVFAVDAAGLCFDFHHRLSSVVIKAQSWFPESVNRFIVIPASVIPERSRPELVSRWGFITEFWNNFELGGAYQIIKFEENTFLGKHTNYPYDEYKCTEKDRRIGFEYSRAAIETSSPFPAHELTLRSPQKFQDGFRPFGNAWSLRLLQEIEEDKTSNFAVFHGQTLGDSNVRDVLIHKSFLGADRVYLPGAVYRLNGVRKIDDRSSTGKPVYVAFGNIMPEAEKLSVFILEREKGVRRTPHKKEPYLDVRVRNDIAPKETHRLKGNENDLRQVINNHFRDVAAINAIRTGRLDLHLGNPVSLLLPKPTVG